ncbi:MAG: zf-HC2 domain-containing protein [Planctomycetes bacterium]|nr:zf-HC2 domain-containing protein [Planctomycetota bacterium]
MNAGTSPGLTCDAVREQLAALAHDEVPPPLRADLDGHLERCSPCETEYRLTREILRVASGVPGAQPRPETWLAVKMQTTAQGAVSPWRAPPQAWVWIVSLFLLPVALVAARIAWTLLRR